jgi:Cys-tRNA(Pro) deacylase
MVKDRIPNTRAIMALKGKSVTFKPHLYKYQKDDVTKAAAREIGAPEHVVIKTVIMEDDAGNPLIVLMHGDRQVSTRALARALGAKSVGPVDTKAAQRLTGYLVGGISPFGTRRELPVYVEESILELPRLYINGGRRGLLIEMSPSDLVKVLRPTLVNVAI